MPTGRPTIADVARAAGVSKGAVSFVLNGRGGVSTQTREHILAVIDELGWVPSRRARGLSTSRAYALGLVIARPADLLGTDPFFAQFIAGAEAELSGGGSVLVLQVVAPSQQEQAYRALAADRRVDGVFLLDLRVDDPRIRLVEELGLPAVTVNHPQTASPFPAVNVDDVPAVRAAIEHLVSLGHRRIGHVSGPPGFVHSAARRRAWADALKAAGIPRGPLVRGDFTPRSGARATRKMLDQPDPPTAIVFANDLMAMAGMAVAQERGVHVPGALSVVGFDDLPLADHLHPPLTSVRADVVKWGQTAARVLLDLTDGRSTHDIDLPPAELVIRGSTAERNTR